MLSEIAEKQKQKNDNAELVILPQTDFVFDIIDSNEEDNNFKKNCITGGEDHFLSPILKSIENAVSIDIIVSFIMESGVRLLAKRLKSAAHRGVKIRILTGSYLNITSPQHYICLG